MSSLETAAAARAFRGLHIKLRYDRFGDFWNVGLILTVDLAISQCRMAFRAGGNAVNVFHSCLNRDVDHPVYMCWDGTEGSFAIFRPLLSTGSFGVFLPLASTERGRLALGSPFELLQGLFQLGVFLTEGLVLIAKTFVLLPKASVFLPEVLPRKSR